MKILTAMMLMIISLGVCGQEQSALNFINANYLKNLNYFNTRLSGSAENEFYQELAEFCEGLAHQGQKHQSKKAFLQRVFYKVQKTYLKKYTQYSTFEELMKEGRYDCVSGTALYALVLNTLGFEVRIQETPFHTYLLVFLCNDQKVLIESTSMGQGFITDEKKIISTIKQFIHLHQQEVPREIHILNRVISIKELAGLEKYNQAVFYFNLQNFNKSNALLVRAMELYPSERVAALKALNQKYQDE